MLFSHNIVQIEINPNAEVANPYAYIPCVIWGAHLKNPKGVSYRISAEDELEKVSTMDGISFEKWCGGLLDESELNVESISFTKGSGDQGVDFIAKIDGILFAVQCKRYTGSVGNKSVQEVLAGKAFYHCQAALVMTNSQFTKSAKELAQATNVTLYDRDVLLRLIGQVKRKTLGPVKTQKDWQDKDRDMQRIWDTVDGIDEMWPSDMHSLNIDGDYYSSLPDVPKNPKMQEYVKCFALGGEDESYNPFPLFDEEPELQSLIGISPAENFTTQEEAQHFFDAVTKRYYAVPDHPVRQMSDGKWSFGGFTALTYLVREAFSEKDGCFWFKNWAD